MDPRDYWRRALACVFYQEGELVRWRGSYRHEVVSLGYRQGRQTATFRDGFQGNFGSYVELIRPDGSPLLEGGAIVPVLPDGRFITIVEQRPAQGRAAGRPFQLLRDDGTTMINLLDYGEYASLEFPSGGTNPKEPIGKALLRELGEETDPEKRRARLYIGPCYYPHGSDLRLVNRSAVIFLTGFGHATYVHNDGGLHVLALTRKEMERAFRRQVIVAAQAGIIPWDLFRQVEEARRSPELEAELVKDGYLEVYDVQL